MNGFRELNLTERDYNGADPLCFGRIQYYSSYNIRSGTSNSFIKPAIKRKNLFTTLNSLATKLLIKEEQVFGVEFLRNGQTYNAYASNEVIVSCGTINTPQLLMLSGIGPAEELRKHNIKVIADLPVGKNMLDHMMFHILRYRLVSLNN